MRALTLWRPWPWAIFHAPRNPKRIENRPWKPWPRIIDVPIALHAGKTFDSEAAEMLCARFGIHPDGDVPRGWRDEGLIGVATVRGFVMFEVSAESLFGQGEWFSGPYAWVLDDVAVFREPIPCRGRQGLWEVGPVLDRRIADAVRVAA